MLDCADDLFDHGSCSSIDPLLGTAARERRKQCLLPPYGFFARALVANMVAH